MSGPPYPKFSPEYLALAATYPERWWRWRNLPFFLNLALMGTAWMWGVGWFHDRFSIAVVALGLHLFVGPLYYDIWRVHREEVVRWDRKALRKLRGEEREVLARWIRQELRGLRKERDSRSSLARRMGVYSLGWSPPPVGRWWMVCGALVVFTALAVARMGHELDIPVLRWFFIFAPATYFAFVFLEWRAKQQRTAVARRQPSR